MKSIVYLRVSTRSQGRSGLGLEAQRESVRRHLNGSEAIAEYQEIESGRKNNRPELAEALAHAKRTGATLVISTISRLSRNTRFLLALLDSGVAIEFCDLPQLSGAAGRFLLTSLAGAAELESGLVSERTVAALSAAKRRGKRLGAQTGSSPFTKYNAEHGNAAGILGNRRAADARAEAWRGVIEAMVAEGLGNTKIAETLNGRGETSVCGGAWTATGIRRLRARLAAIASKTADFQDFGLESAA